LGNVPRLARRETADRKSGGKCSALKSTAEREFQLRAKNHGPRIRQVSGFKGVGVVGNAGVIFES